MWLMPRFFIIQNRKWQSNTNDDMKTQNSKTNLLIVVAKRISLFDFYLIWENQLHEKDIFASQLCCSLSIHYVLYKQQLSKKNTLTKVYIYIYILLINILSLVKANPSKDFLCNTMLFGENGSLVVSNLNINKQIFFHVQHFLCDTKRLCMFSNMQLTKPLH